LEPLENPEHEQNNGWNRLKILNMTIITSDTLPIPADDLQSIRKTQAQAIAGSDFVS
jgi:hypothetical protein